MKKFIAVILSATTIFTCGTNVFADEVKAIQINQSMEIKNAKKNAITSPEQISSDNAQKVFINEKPVEIEEGIVVYENRVFLPVRELAEALGLSVDYNQQEKIVILDDGKIQLPVNQNKAVVNGNIVAVDNENVKIGTIVINDKTYLPLRFVSESLGYNVNYLQDKKEVYINTAQASDAVVLDTAQAVEAYKQIAEANKNIKNATSDINAKFEFNMSDDTNNMNMKMDMVGTTKMDIKDKVNMYSEY